LCPYRWSVGLQNLARNEKLKMHVRFLLILSFVVAGFASPAGVAGDSRRVVVVVWDGMRPDFVSEENTPTLWKLAKDAVVFRNHHAVYLSATNVNGAALATGDYPGHTGLIANHEFRPTIDNRRPVDVEDPRVVRKGDDLSGGKYIAAPTIAEIVQKSGERTIIAASKTVGLLHDRHFDVREKNGVTLSAGRTWPDEIIGWLAGAIGPFPTSHSSQDSWTTKALTDVFWKEGVPAFSLLWLGQPDLTQHETAPGAPAALRAIKSSDDNLAAVLSALDRQHVRQKTDVFVVSDHGFSTIEHEIELPKILANAGFKVVTEFNTEPQTGQIMVVGGGGSVLFYVVHRDAAVTQRLVEFLQRSDFAGVIFTKSKFEGTFSLDQGKIDSADAPDVVLSFRWNENKNQFGVEGMIDADWQRAVGKGTHATLSRFDMHNTLIAAGPDFRRGETDDLPSGNIDLAPTILKILGITTPNPMDGRVLAEVMTGSNLQALKPETETFEATKRFSSGTWRQRLYISRVGSTIYLDGGNGAFEAHQKAAAP
jgi:arylsulfatase A-like enzyme